jgi:hypothetical protein
MVLRQRLSQRDYRFEGIEAKAARRGKPWNERDMTRQYTSHRDRHVQKMSVRF